MKQVVKRIEADYFGVMDRWIADHLEDFGDHPPLLLSTTAEWKTYVFKGITKSFQLNVSVDGDCELVIVRRKELFDYYVDILFLVKKTAAGRYYCEMCEGKYRKYYRSLERFFIIHSCSAILEYLKKIFLPEMRLVMIEGPGYGQALIVPASKLHEPKYQRRSNSKVFEIKSFVIAQRSGGR